MAGWFYVESGRAVGPMSRIELEAATRSGRVTPDTLVCEDGQDEWRLARKVPGLVPPKLLKAWQASVAAARVEPAPPPPPARAPAPPRRVQAASPAVPAPAPAEGSGPPPGLRRHAGLIAVATLAAAGGAILGAVLVARIVVPNVAPPTRPPDPAAARPAPSAAATSGPGGGLRPELPPAPPALPPEAAALVEREEAALAAALADYGVATERFLEGGGLDAATLASREALASRGQALEELRTRNEGLRRGLSALPDAVREAATREGLALEVADAAARRARADMASEARAREQDAEMHDVAGEMLGLLEESFGSWTLRGRSVEFAAGAGSDFAQRYARLLEDAAAITAR